MSSPSSLIISEVASHNVGPTEASSVKSGHGGTMSGMEVSRIGGNETRSEKVRTDIRNIFDISWEVINRDIEKESNTLDLQIYMRLFKSEV